MFHNVRCVMLIVIFACVVLCYNNGKGLSDEKNARYSSRIVGGKKARIVDYPYVAFVAYYCDETGVYTFLCTGTIIGKRWILTAAHCPGNATSEPDVYVGSDKMYKGQLYEVKRSVKHKDYKYVDRLDYFDIMVLELKRNLMSGSKVRPIQLGRESDLLYNKMATIAGFGLDRDPNDTYTKTIACGLWNKTLKKNENLRAVELPIISHDRCAANEGYEYLVSISDFCAGYMDEGKGPCQGDSGSPLVINGRVIGIGSGVIDECGTAPGVFVSVPLTTKWILSVTGKL